MQSEILSVAADARSWCKLFKSCFTLHYIVISKVLYALPAWGGYISQENINWINKLFQKAQLYSFPDNLHSFKYLMNQSDEKLFSRMICSNHCLYHLLHRDRSSLHMSSRSRGQSFDVPRYKHDLTRKSFSGVYIITDNFSKHALWHAYHRLRGSASTVLTATSQVNGRWRILTPHRIETHEPTATKFRTIDYVRGRTP